MTKLHVATNYLVTNYALLGRLVRMGLIFHIVNMHNVGWISVVLVNS